MCKSQINFLNLYEYGTKKIVQHLDFKFPCVGLSKESLFFFLLLEICQCKPVVHFFEFGAKFV
jgi:hypothetical protein